MDNGLFMHTQRDERAAAVKRGLQAELDLNDKRSSPSPALSRDLITDPAIALR